MPCDTKILTIAPSRNNSSKWCGSDLAVCESVRSIESHWQPTFQGTKEKRGLSILLFFFLQKPKGILQIGMQPENAGLINSGNLVTNLAGNVFQVSIHWEIILPRTNSPFYNSLCLRPTNTHFEFIQVCVFKCLPNIRLIGLLYCVTATRSAVTRGEKWYSDSCHTIQFFIQISF